MNDNADSAHRDKGIAWMQVLYKLKDGDICQQLMGMWAEHELITSTKAMFNLFDRTDNRAYGKAQKKQPCILGVDSDSPSAGQQTNNPAISSDAPGTNCQEDYIQLERGENILGKTYQRSGWLIGNRSKW